MAVRATLVTVQSVKRLAGVAITSYWILTNYSTSGKMPKSGQRENPVLPMMPTKKNGGKSVLMTPDPYHTPGYCGFCPQFKFQISETFGRTTHRLLTNPNVASSGRIVLADVQPAPGPECPGKHYLAVRNTRARLLQKRTASFGDQKLGEKMVPGYTGYIPKGQHHYGDRYAEYALNAISDFEQDQTDHRAKTASMRRIRDIQEGRVEPNNEEKQRQWAPKKTPLKPISDARTILYRSPYEKQYSTSPYYVSDDNPRKCFVSGYTGFVPSTRGQLGIGYPLITNRGLVEFTSNPKHGLDRFKDLDMSGEQEHQEWERLQHYLMKPHKPTKPHTVYHRTSGLVPLYTGHIPGQKFRYGTTFGRSTRNAKRLPVEIKAK